MKALISYMEVSAKNTTGAEQQKCIEILDLLKRRARIKRNVNKLRIAILKIITAIAVIGLLTGTSMIESGNMAQGVVLSALSLAWLALIIIAN